MANKVVNYKKIRTDIINGKKRCIYMKPKGKREYVKSNGEFVLLSVYIKKMQKKMKIKGGFGYFNEDGRYIYTSTPLKNRVQNMLSNTKSYMQGLRGKTVNEYKPPSELYEREATNFDAQQQLDKEVNDDMDIRVANESNINANNIGLRHRKSVSNIMNFFRKPTSTPPSNNKTFNVHADKDKKESSKVTAQLGYVRQGVGGKNIYKK
jgi:hypothetical protein